MRIEYKLLIFEALLLLSSVLLGYCIGRIVSITEMEEYYQYSIDTQKYFIDREITIQENFKDFYRCRPEGNITKINIVVGDSNDTR